MLSLVVLACGSSSPGRLAEAPVAPAGAGAGREPPVLVVMLDAVPWEVMSEARRRGLFAELHPPVPVVSSFPSTTTVSLAGTFVPLGMRRPPGYEARFFDWQQARVRGGGPISYNRIDTYWADFFDWHVENPIRKGFGFLRPLRFARWEMQRGLERFLASGEPVFLTYVSATDGAAHLHGPDELLELLAALDELLAAARQRRDFVTVLFSDHGIEGSPAASATDASTRNESRPPPLQNVRTAIAAALGQAGYRLGDRLRQPGDVVWVRYGLLTSAVLFTAPGDESQVARTVAAVPGVDLCAARDRAAERWPVFADGSEAVVERRDVDGSAVELRLRGDSSVLGEELPAERWLSPAEWLRASWSAALPDAPYRIVRAFDLVDNAASVVCSLAPPAMVGSALTDWSGRLTVGPLRWTHGSLRRDASLGVVATDHPGWNDPDQRPQVLRHDEVLERLLPDEWRRQEGDGGPGGGPQGEPHPEHVGSGS
ncbi:MAG: hypothetical protein DWQ36_00610 [Acidobacteria bacterium]|nr:MAG: hypothetical protein DWQ30_18770 [Acidobacteriota bacterium]REK12195.1 MAG: hypothetical protein DWQ36_00610 [Acidobacteriota bacterium]